MRTKPAPVPPFRVAGLIPKLIAARLRRARPPAATFLCIYREPNLATTLEMVGQAEASGWDIRLWALGEVHPDLARHTVGHGPGGRFELFNRLAEGVPERQWLAIADDDSRIAWPWTLATFLTVCARFGFDLAQPAQVWYSFHWSSFNEQHHGVIARETTYVESGPILAISPRLRPRIMPFPEDTTMGYGEDLNWTDFVAEGYRLGVVDGVPLEHLNPVAALYDTGPERVRGEAILAEHGLDHITQVMHTLRRFRWLPVRNVRSVMRP
jgi:hypothetical protein